MFRILSVLVIGISAFALQMIRLLVISIVFVCAASVQSCTTEPEDTFTTTGIIAYRSDVFTDFKGFYCIIGDDGSEYYPTNLPDEFHHERMRVRFEARELPNTRPIVGWGNGPVIELVHIQAL